MSRIKRTPTEAKISGKKLLEALAEQMQAYVCKLNDSELEALHAACKRASTTNCYWLIYRASLGVIELASEEQRNRTAIAFFERDKSKSKPVGEYCDVHQEAVTK